MAHDAHHDAHDGHDDHDHHEEPPPPEPETPLWFTLVGAVLFVFAGVVFVLMAGEPAADAKGGEAKPAASAEH